MSQRALDLLTLFPSPKIVDAIIQVVLDPNRGPWERTYAIRVLTYVQEPLLIPQIQQLFNVTEIRYDGELLDEPHATFALNDYFVRMIESLHCFVEHHPENKGWYSQVIERLRDRLQAIMPNKGYEHVSECLESLATNRDCSGYDVADSADEADSEPIIPQPQPEKQPYEASPLWQALENLYHEARDGHYKAYWRLREITRKWKGEIPIQAVSTYFLGLLQDVYEEDHILTTLRGLTHAYDYWEYNNNGYYFAPIRSEAIYALRFAPSPRVWETLIDSAFINLNNDLDYQLFGAIERLTKQLSDPSIPRFPKGIHSLEELHRRNKPKRMWFRVLAEMPHDLDYYFPP